jgi:O-6-methylguanine DNA methyltransferase
MRFPTPWMAGEKSLYFSGDSATGHPRPLFFIKSYPVVRGEHYTVPGIPDTSYSLPGAVFILDVIIYFMSTKTSSFRAKVLAVTKMIPLGKTLTYKQVAIKAGSPKAARAVGAVLKTNFDPRIPCHRVIRSDGTLGGYNRGVKNKAKILLAEDALLTDL